jgi:hypothetical protein
MTTARTIIRKAMQKVGILTKTEQPSADEASDALDTLNDLFGSIANETSMTSVRSVEAFPLTANQASYTIGAGGNFNTSRPTSIVSGYIRSGTIDYPLTPIADVTYDRDIPVKTTASIPEFFFFNNGFPTATVTFYPVPLAGYTAYLRMEKPLTTLTLDGTIELPPGWNQYLVYQLAVLLAPEYGVQLDPKVQEVAMQSKDNIMLTVQKARTMDAVPLDEMGAFNIYSSRYR